MSRVAPGPEHWTHIILSADFWSLATASILGIATLIVSFRLLRGAWLDNKAKRMTRDPAHDPKLVSNLQLRAECYRKLAGFRHPLILAFLFVMLFAQILLRLPI